METRQEPVATHLLWWVMGVLVLLVSAGGAAWVRSLEGQVADTRADVKSQELRVGDVRERMMRVETKVENVQKSVDDQKTDLSEIKGILRGQQNNGAHR